MVKKLLFLVVVLVFVANASAASWIWNNTAPYGGDGTTDFEFTGNWYAGWLPNNITHPASIGAGDGHIYYTRGDGDHITIDGTGFGHLLGEGSNQIIDIENTAVSCLNFHPANKAGVTNTTVNMDNASLGGGYLWMGEVGLCTWNVVDSQIGDGLKNVKLSDDATTVGVYDLDNSHIFGSTVQYATGTFTLTLRNGSSMKDGASWNSGDKTLAWQALETAGQLNAGSGEVLVYAYDGLYTTVTAVPEPATIALLGLGSMLMIRRKRA